jgi:hypothetical protein
MPHLSTDKWKLTISSLSVKLFEIFFTQTFSYCSLHESFKVQVAINQ